VLLDHRQELPMKRYETWIWLAVFALLVFLFTHFDKKKDCNITPVPSYLNDRVAYRKHRLQDALDEVDQNGGDIFDKEAAEKRVLSILDAQLESERAAELAFATNVYQKAVASCDSQ
jgi:hypothetical protein